MSEFLVGLLVLVLMAVLSGLGVLLIPIILLMGFFLRWIIGILLILFSVWLVGKITLALISLLKNKKK